MDLLNVHCSFKSFKECSGNTLTFETDLFEFRQILVQFPAVNILNYVCSHIESKRTAPPKIGIFIQVLPSTFNG